VACSSADSERLEGGGEVLDALGVALVRPREDDGEVGLPNEPVGYRAQPHPREGAAAVGGHHDDIDLPGLGLLL